MRYFKQYLKENNYKLKIEKFLGIYIMMIGDENSFCTICSTSDKRKLGRVIRKYNRKYKNEM